MKRNNETNEKKDFYLATGNFTSTTVPLAGAQQSAKVPRIGFLVAGSASSVSARIEAFRQGLRELGYIEGKNIVIEWRFAEGKSEHVPRLRPS